MVKKKISKSQSKKEIEDFFSEVKNKTPKDIKKIKRTAMSYNIPLKEKRKLFCGKCFSVYRKPKIRIKDKTKIVDCEKCGYVAKWKLKLS